MQLQKLSRCEACFLQPAGLAVYGRHQAPVGEIRALPLAARGIGGLLVLPLPQECERKGEAGSDGYAPIQADGLANEADPTLQAARSSERRAGTECVSTCRSRGAPHDSKKN